MKRTSLVTISVLLILFSLTGCSWIFTNHGVIIPDDEYSLTEIKGDVRCEFRLGKNAAYDGKYVNTDSEFDKEEFVKLFNEFNSCDPAYLSDNLDKCDLKLSSETEPDEWNEIFDSEIYIKAVFDGTHRGVSVFTHDSELYFHVLNFGGRTRPEGEGDYFIKLTPESVDYWRPIIEQVLKDGGR